MSENLVGLSVDIVDTSLYVNSCLWFVKWVSNRNGKGGSSYGSELMLHCWSGAAPPLGGFPLVGFLLEGFLLGGFLLGGFPIEGFPWAKNPDSPEKPGTGLLPLFTCIPSLA